MTPVVLCKGKSFEPMEYMPRNHMDHDRMKIIMVTIRDLIVGLLSKPFMDKSGGSILEGTEDPAYRAKFWISAFGDCSRLFGFCYQLCDESVAIAFNDGTKLILLANNGADLRYIDNDGTEQYFENSVCPHSLSLKKGKLLWHFRDQGCHERRLLLRRTGDRLVGDEAVCVPYIYHWYRSKRCITMFLTNDTVQFNFRNKHKLVFCQEMKSVTHITDDCVFHTYRFSTIEREGYSSALFKHLNNALMEVGDLMLKSSDFEVFC